MNSQKESMNKCLQKVKLKWVEIETFFNEIEKFFEFKDDKKFYCCINNQVVCSYFNEIFLVYFKEFDKNLNKNEKEKILSEATFIVGGEILHLLYFGYAMKIFKKNFTLEKIYDLENDNYSGWHLVELMQEYLLAHNPIFKKFGWDKIGRERQGYSWISEIRKKTDLIFKKNNFRDFIKKSTNLFSTNLCVQTMKKPINL